MHPFIRLIGIAMIAASLSACETADSKKVEVQSAQPAMSDEQIEHAYTEALRTTGNSSVEVFSLDDHDMSAPYMPEANPLTPAPHLPQGTGKAFGGNANVTVFPLDGAPTYGAPGAIPAMIPPAAPTALTPAPYDQGHLGTDNIPRIYFNHGDVGVNQAGKQVTAAVASQCRAGGCGLVKVEGHASTRAIAKDEIQRRMINLKVSMDRALNVTRQLIRDGMPADNIQVVAHGDRVPPLSVPNADPEAAARRVEILTGSSNPLMY